MEPIFKDREMEGHARRVTAFSVGIARAMGLPRDQIQTIARGAFLHDIGEIAIPDGILNKPGKLEPEEFAIMKEHAHLGYEMVKETPSLAEAVEIVYSHQERFDGSGYPRGLKGEHIPLGARIAAVADALDSITSDRPYRPARTLTAAREEIQAWSGRQFDPQLVSVFQRVPDEIFEELRQQVGPNSDGDADR